MENSIRIDESLLHTCLQSWPEGDLLLQTGESAEHPSLWMAWWPLIKEDWGEQKPSVSFILAPNILPNFVKFSV